MYINDLPNGLKSNEELFADDTSLFTIVKDKNESVDILKDDLQLILNWPINGECSLTQIQKTCPRSIIFKKNPNSRSSNFNPKQYSSWKINLT